LGHERGHNVAMKYIIITIREPNYINYSNSFPYIIEGKTSLTLKTAAASVILTTTLIPRSNL